MQYLEELGNVTSNWIFYVEIFWQFFSKKKKNWRSFQDRWVSRFIIDQHREFGVENYIKYHF